MVNLNISSILIVLLVLGGIPSVSALNDAFQQSAVIDPDQFSLASKIALMTLWGYNQEDSTAIIPTNIKSLNELAKFLNTKMSKGNKNQEGLTATPIATTREYLQNGDIVHLKNNPSVFMIYRYLDEGDNQVILEDYSGIYYYSLTDFDKVFTGFAITFQKDYQGYNLDKLGITITDQPINNPTIQAVITPILIGKLPPGRYDNIVPLDYKSKIKENAAFYIPNTAKIDIISSTPKFTEWVKKNIATPDDYEMTMENPDIKQTKGKKIIKLYTNTHKIYYSITSTPETKNTRAAWNKFKVANKCGSTLGMVKVAYYQLVNIAGQPLPFILQTRKSTRYNLENDRVLNYDPSAEFNSVSITVFKKKSDYFASAWKLHMGLGNWHTAYVRKDRNYYIHLA